MAANFLLQLLSAGEGEAFLPSPPFWLLSYLKSCHLNKITTQRARASLYEKHILTGLHVPFLSINLDDYLTTLYPLC